MIAGVPDAVILKYPAIDDILYPKASQVFEIGPSLYGLHHKDELLALALSHNSLTGRGWGYCSSVHS